MSYAEQEQELRLATLGKEREKITPEQVRRTLAVSYIEASHRHREPWRGILGDDFKRKGL